MVGECPVIPSDSSHPIVKEFSLLYNWNSSQTEALAIMLYTKKFVYNMIAEADSSDPSGPKVIGE